MSESPPRPGWGAGASVLLVVVLGLLVGFALAFALPQVSPPQPPCQGPPNCSAPANPPLGQVHISVVLATLTLTLLAALLVVYGRTYLETRALQILGLSIFLVALLFEAVLTSPFIFARYGLAPGALEPFLLVGQLFECAALVIFLYLSLQ